MKTFRVEPTDKALLDAAETYFWIREHSEDAALRWYDGLFQALHSLEKNPFQCPHAPESVFFKEEIRQLTYGRYRILFTVAGETVFVLASGPALGTTSSRLVKKRMTSKRLR